MIKDTSCSTVGSELASSEISFSTVFGDALILQLGLTMSGTSGRIEGRPQTNS